MEWIGVASGLVGTLVAVIALWLSRRDKAGDELKMLTARVITLETQMQPFWAAIQADMIKLLHHPWPERIGMDALLDKLKAGELTPAEEVQLRALLGQVISDEAPFPVDQGERAVAVFLLHSMDIVGGTVKQEVPHPDQPAMVGAANAIMRRVERALRIYRWLLALIGLVVLLLVGGYFQLKQVQQDQHQAQLDQRAAQIAACRAGNDYRAGDELGWRKAMALAIGPHPTTQAAQFATELLAYIHQLDQPKDCTRG